jgi:hypothetical protein
VSGLRLPSALFSRLSESHRLHAKRIATSLRDLQERSVIASDIDPDHPAVALGAMIEQSLRWWVAQVEPFDPEHRTVEA